MNILKIKNLQNIILLYFIVIFCSISVSGGLVYYFYALNYFGIFIALLLSGLLVNIFYFAKRKHSVSKIQGLKKPEVKKSSFDILLLFMRFLYYFCLSVGFYFLISSQTIDSIISPWQVIDVKFYFTYILALVFLILLLKKDKKYRLFNLILFYLLSFLIIPIIYKIGYGFDFFIHNASMEYIINNGFIEPKTPYYLGMYAVIVILNKLFGAPIAVLGKFLIPVLAAIYIPYFLFRNLMKKFDNKSNILVLILILLILPFGIFTYTTPQNLSYLFLFLTVIASLKCKNYSDLYLVYLFALTALVNQPISGIPALLLAIFTTIYHSEIKIKKILYPGLAFVSAFIIPLSFYIVNHNQISNQSETGEQSNFIAKLFQVQIPNSESVFLNFVYLINNAYVYFILFILILGFFLARKYRSECRHYFIYLLGAGSLILSYLLSLKISFGFLIEYERDNYTNRILISTLIVLMPFVWLAMYWLIMKYRKQNFKIKIIFTIATVVLLLSSLYLSYPRFDNYHNSHGLSVSQSDIDAVSWIENNSSVDYIVLANQQVSAAALKQYGFKKYYKDNIFYYPIPTGGPLYQYYLKMVYEKPERKTMLEAMDMAGVDTGYFVLNKYWWAFPKILEEAKAEANSWQEIDSDEIYIFKYKK